MYNRAAVAALTLAGTTASFMLTIVIPLQPALPALLSADAGSTAWVVTSSLLASAVVIPISGRLGDMYGKRRVTLVLLTLLVVGSLISALTSSLGPMVVGRALQGVGMGVIPLGISILFHILPFHRVGPATALVSSTVGVGSALSQPISAIVAERLDWHLIFVIASVLGAASFALILRVVPSDAGRVQGSFDWLGAIGLALGLCCVLLYLSRGNELGWTSTAAVGLLAGGVAIFLAWGWWELRHENAIVNLRVSASRPVLFTNLAAIGMGFTLYAVNIIYPRLLQAPLDSGGFGLTLLQASLIMMTSGLSMLAISSVVGRVEVRTGPKPLLVMAALIIGFSYLLAAVLDLRVWQILVLNLLTGIGGGAGFAAMATLTIRAAPRHETAAATSLNALMRSLGTTTAAAVMASVLAASAVTSESTGGVPSAVGFHATFIIGALSAAATAGVAVLIPRRERPPDGASRLGPS